MLMGNSGVTAGLGFIFWTLAARLYAPTEVGIAAAAISAALFLATIAMLGLPSALVRFYPSAGLERAVLTSTVLVVVTTASAVAGAIFIVNIAVWAPALSGLASPAVLAAGFISLAAATGAAGMMVFVAASARDARPALAGGIAQGVVKGILILVFALSLPRLGFAMLLAWLLGTIAGALLQVWLLRALMTLRIDLRLLRLGFVQFSAGNYAGDLAWAAPSLLFPLLVVGRLGAEAGAFFYVPWAIASLLVAIPSAVATSLLAEGSHALGSTDEHLRRSFVLALVLVVPAVLVCWIGAPVLLGLFGAPYAANGVDTLRLLAVAALPLSLNVLHLTVARVHRDIRRLLAICIATGGGALVTGFALVGQYGVIGIGFAYLAAQSVVALVLTAEWLLRTRATRASTPDSRS